MLKNIINKAIGQCAVILHISAIIVGLSAVFSTLSAKTYPLCTKKEVLVRVTFYYPNEDKSGFKGSTGVKLKPWVHCAVDPKKIPYGRSVAIPGIGVVKAVDTGSAVKSMKAAKEWGKTVPVIDVCVANRKEMDRMAREFPRFVKVRISV